MSEGIVLPVVARETLLPERERLERLESALPQIHAVVADESDVISLQATLACLLWETCIQCNWCGFYRRVAPDTLAVGPYQGTLGCLRVALSRGVCGAAARTQQIQLVPDVERFPGHIACDSRSRSELVIPIVSEGETQAVLDLDSPHLDAFSRAETALIAELLQNVFALGRVVWGR